MNKTYTLALVQAVVHTSLSITLTGGPDMDADGSDLKNIFGNVKGDVNIGGDLNIHGDYHHYGDVGSSPGSGDNGGNDGGNDGNNDGGSNLESCLMDWFNEVPSQCTGDATLLSMLDQPNPDQDFCHEIRDFMVDILDTNNFNIAQLQNDVKTNRQYMSNDVLLKFRGQWMLCYPEHMSGKKWTSNQASINANFYRDYEPWFVYDYGDPTCEMVSGGYNAHLDKMLIQEINMYDVYYNWWKDQGQINGCIEDENSLQWMIMSGDMECTDLQNVLVEMLVETSMNYEQLRADFNTRSYMKQQPKEAWDEKIELCFPDLPLPGATVDAGYVRALQRDGNFS